MRNSNYGVVVMLCFLLMPNFLVQQISVLALNEKCFNECINGSLCEAPRISQCVQRCRSLCGGALHNHASPSSCKFFCSFNLCSKFSSDEKEHRDCSEKCSKKYCKID